MTTRTRVPALGAEGWFTPAGDEPALLGQQCATCGTYAFPKAADFVKTDLLDKAKAAAGVK